MAETAAEQKDTVEQREVSKEELSLVVDILHSFIKTMKAYRMYLSNNPLLHRFVDDLKAGLRSFLEKYKELKLDIDQFEFKYLDKTVYDNRDAKESLAFKMYSDGIRSIIFSEGLEEREIREFLEVISRERGNDIDDDIVTLLWMKDLPNITYLLAEDYLEFDNGAGQFAPASQEEGIKSAYRSIPQQVAPPTTPMMVPQNILTLSDKEILWLKKAREYDEKQNPLDEVMNILAAILAAERDFQIFGEFINITVNLVGNLIRSGDVKYSLKLIFFLRDMTRNERLSQAHREKIYEAFQKAVNIDLIKDLEEIINHTEKIDPDHLKELLLLFGRHGIAPVCELLASAEKMDMRRVIIDVLCEIGKDTPDAFYPFLSDRRWYLVRNTLLVLRKIGSPASLEHVSKLINHREPRIRKEVLSYLESIDDPRAKGYMVRFLSDTAGAIRLHALKDLGAAKYQPALKQVMEIADSKDFDRLDAAEKRAVYEALGELGGDELVPQMKKMLLKKYWFKKEKEKEAVILSVAALRKVGTDAAMKALEEALAVKKKDFRPVINQAIAALSVGKTVAAPKSPEG